MFMQKQAHQLFSQIHDLYINTLKTWDCILYYWYLHIHRLISAEDMAKIFLKGQTFSTREHWQVQFSTLKCCLFNKLLSLSITSKLIYLDLIWLTVNVFQLLLKSCLLTSADFKHSTTINSYNHSLKNELPFCHLFNIMLCCIYECD